MKSILFFLLLAASCLSAEADTVGEMITRATMRGDLKTLETLLSNGASPDSPDRYGQTPLYLALLSNEIPAAQLLLHFHADPNAQGANRASLLQLVAQSGNQRMASILISSGANLNAPGPGGRTALHYTGGRQLGMMQLLIENGADVNVRDAEGASPLDEAAWNGLIDAAAILLAHGARLNESDTQTGATPLNEAAFRGHTALVRYLLQFHPNLEIPDKRGFTALDNATRMGKEEAAILLLEAEPKDGLSEKIMDTAIRKNESLLVDALLRNGADANRVLEDAALNGSDAVVAVLLDHGAQVNRLNAGSGTTALYAAASFGKLEVVKLLLDRGADPGLCGRARSTPYQAALANGFGDVAARIQGPKTCRQ